MTDKSAKAEEILWIRELAGILDETGLSEIEIEKADVRVRVCRAVAPVAAIAAPPVVHAPAPAPAAEPTSGHAAPPGSAAAKDGPPAGAVTSPMVGTIYLTPSPGAEPFAKVGDQVAEGQTLMIVEAMKTMNPVSAPRAGTVKEILVRNEQPVEFGEPLIVIA